MGTLCLDLWRQELPPLLGTWEAGSVETPLPRMRAESAWRPGGPAAAPARGKELVTGQAATGVWRGSQAGGGAVPDGGQGAGHQAELGRGSWSLLLERTGLLALWGPGNPFSVP